MGGLAGEPAVLGVEMRVAWWRLWLLGIAWVVVASLTVGAAIGAVLGFVYGLQSSGEPYSSGGPASALLMAAFGATMGAIYGGWIGVPTGVVATAVYAWVAQRQLLDAPVAAWRLRWQAAGIAAAVQGVAVALYLGAISGAFDGFGYWLTPVGVAAGVAALGAPGIVRLTAGPGAVRRRDADVRPVTLPSVD